MIVELALLSSLALSAPQAPTEGLFMEVPTTLVGEAVSGTNEVLYAGAGFSTAVLASNLSPRMMQSAMFAASPPLNVVQNGAIKFGAISRGTSYVTVDIQGDKAVAMLNGSGWGFLLFAVEDDTEGDPGSVYDLDGEDVGSSIYSFVLPGSNVPAHLQDEVHKARSGPEMGMNSIHGIDSYAVAGLGQQAIYPVTRWYFTVSADTCPNIPTGPNGWCDANQNLPSTIFEITHDGTNWSAPSVFLLGVNITRSNEPSENLGNAGIDALTVDTQSRRILLSTDECLADRELVVVDYALGYPNSGVFRPYYDMGGNDFFVRTHLKLDPQGTQGPAAKEGVKGVCADDPFSTVNQYEYGESSQTWLMYRDDWRRQYTAMPRIERKSYSLKPNWSAHQITIGKKGEGQIYQFHLNGFTQANHVYLLYRKNDAGGVLVDWFAPSPTGKQTISRLMPADTGDIGYYIVRLTMNGQTIVAVDESQPRYFYRD